MGRKQIDFMNRNFIKQIVGIIGISFPCSTLFFTAVNALQLHWESDDSCCLFSNSCINCAEALFPIGRA